ncbi:STAS domain-containing protein [Halobacillus campisalis]|uniref:STAS domain-containing protein n=1 Tax=Halobacillus campisalis TaxID=435909 RepID=A0ABW2K036_9BACI|nr:STAS domain-containing protein [Halobacillus campisalis]
MKEELNYIGNKIITDSMTLAEQVENFEKDEYVLSLANSSLSREEVLAWRAQMFIFMGEALIEDYESVKNRVIAWTKEVGEKAIESDVPLNETIALMGAYRNILWQTFDKELQENRFAAITVLDVNKLVNPLLDEVIFQFSQLYIRYNNRKYQKAQDKLTELSVPVVPVAERVAVLPVVGEVDEDRAQLIMEMSLQKSSHYQLEYLLIDISGVPKIDARVAHNLLQVVQSLELVGVQTILTGLRPEIARSVVAMGVNFSKVKTRANLKQSLSEIGIGGL